ncbi:MAG TPA: cytochrome c maturation protein CcmE [Thermodesulfobacteriota bacterium]|nr:cytochrome c maturation protein CcmE [Thermodesulfobacteriota bacterium]
MTRGRIKFVLAIVVVVLALSYLVYGGVKGTMVYYLTVEELKERAPSVYKEKVRVSGKVVPGSITRDINGALRFQITDGKQTIDVEYKGIVPDIFKDGVEAVVEGLYTPQNVFNASVLLAKCPTKYESVDSLKKGEST